MVIGLKNLVIMEQAIWGIIAFLIFFMFLWFNHSNHLPINELIINSVKSVSPTVVSVVVLDKSNEKSSFGSGFIYDKEGFIVTNTHVIRDSENIVI